MVSFTTQRMDARLGSMFHYHLPLGDSGISLITVHVAWQLILIYYDGCLEYTARRIKA